jgi:hypothetical protein
VEEGEELRLRGEHRATEPRMREYNIEIEKRIGK